MNRPAVSSTKTRFWEIDTLRGIAIVLMIFYHLMWDLSFLQLSSINVLQPAWQNFARSIGTTFIFVMGISLVLSYHFAQKKVESEQALFLKYAQRGGRIFLWGMLITVGTYLFIGRGFVIFGILHLLGASIALAYPFLRMPAWLSLVTSGLILGLGFGVWAGEWVQHPYLIWLGLPEAGRPMVDYYPLVPWFGVALAGIFVGKIAYSQTNSLFPKHPLAETPFVQGLVWLGQRSLPIYLIHQPLILGVLYLWIFISG